MAATMGSEATAAAIGQAAIRRDPFAMLPFVGYNMADYWGHWLKMGERKGLKLPQIFRVNWFRKDENGKFIWPGYGQNMRVLKWIVDRVHGRAEAVESPFGLMPRYEDLTWDGLAFDRAAYERITDIRRDKLQREVEGVAEWFAKFGDHLPTALEGEQEKLGEARRGAAGDVEPEVAVSRRPSAVSDEETAARGESPGPRGVAAVCLTSTTPRATWTAPAWSAAELRITRGRPPVRSRRDGRCPARSTRRCPP